MISSRSILKPPRPPGSARRAGARGGRSRRAAPRRGGPARGRGRAGPRANPSRGGAASRRRPRDLPSGARPPPPPRAAPRARAPSAGARIRPPPPGTPRRGARARARRGASRARRPGRAPARGARAAIRARARSGSPRLACGARGSPRGCGSPRRGPPRGAPASTGSGGRRSGSRARPRARCRRRAARAPRSARSGRRSPPAGAGPRRRRRRGAGRSHAPPRAGRPRGRPRAGPGSARARRLRGFQDSCSAFREWYSRPRRMDFASPLRIGDLIRRNARAVPDRPAASLAGRLLSHAELDLAANRVGSALRDLGVSRGERVVAWADTSLEQLALFAGASKLGAVFAPLDARLDVVEAISVASLAGPALLVADRPPAEAAAAVAEALGVRAVGLGSVDGRGDPRTLLHAERRAEDPGEPELRETDPHVMFFTSGSTGRPKGVVLSHRANYLRTFQGVFRDVPEISVCMFPLFHMAGFTLALAAWQTRGEIALVPGAGADAILETVQRRRANRLYCIPSIWQRILDADPARFDTSTLRELDSGTSAVPIELVRALKEAFPGTLTRIYYGSTECGSATSLADADVLRKPGSVGPPSLGVDLRLSEAGEICVRSAYLMDGYFDDPAATAAALREGWFHSGDLGELDDEGHLRVVGRIKEVIRSGGESVAPVEVEAVLSGHPYVAEVAVVGIPDPQWGEIVCAVVVPAAGGTPTLPALQKHCGGTLAAFKKPRRLELVDALPRTPATGQVQRTLLVQRLGVRAATRA